MHAGFTLLEAGSIRLKNLQNILMKNTVAASMGALKAVQAALTEAQQQKHECDRDASHNMLAALPHVTM